jgi:hypothetical protein
VIGVVLWFAVPFAYNLSGFIQDGIRYLLFIYPAVALLCGFGVCRMADWAVKVAGARIAGIDRKRAFWGLTALTTAYLLVTAVSVCPYYLDYYNALAGGPKNVAENRLFKFGWWGEGIKESMDWVGSNAPAHATVIMLTCPEDQANMIFFMHDQVYFFPWLITEGGTNKAYNFTREPYVTTYQGKSVQVQPDYVILNYKAEVDEKITLDDTAYVIVHQSTVQGVPLATVYHRVTASGAMT